MAPSPMVGRHRLTSLLAEVSRGPRCWVWRRNTRGPARCPPRTGCANPHARVPADPPPQLVPAPNVTVSPGETAVLSCRVLGDAPYNLTWVRDWRVLPAAPGRVRQLDDLSLEVSATVPSDGGRYQCIASNANGVSRASTWLLVRGEALPARLSSQVHTLPRVYP